MQEPPKVDGGRDKVVAEKCSQIVHESDGGCVFVLKNDHESSTYSFKYDFTGSSGLKVVPGTKAVSQSSEFAVECVIAPRTAINLCQLVASDPGAGYDLKVKMQSATGASSGFKTTDTQGDETRKAIGNDNKLFILSRRVGGGYEFALENMDDKGDYNITVDFSQSVNFTVTAAEAFKCENNTVSGVAGFATARIPLASLTITDPTAAGAKMMYGLKMTRSTMRWEKMEKERIAREAQKKAEDEAAAAKKKADDEAAAAKKKAEDEAAAAKKKADEEAAAAAAAQKKAEAEAAAAKKKADDEAAAAAAAKKKADDEAAAAAAAAKKALEEAAAASKKRAEEEAAAAAAKKAAEEAEAARKKAEEEAKKNPPKSIKRERKLAKEMNMTAEDALSGIRRDYGPVNWAMFEWNNASPLNFIQGGSQGLLELLPMLKPDTATCSILRMAFGAGHMRRMKYVFVAFLGDSVSAMKRAQLQQHMAAMSKALGAANVEITLRGVEDLKMDVIIKKVEKIFTVDGPPISVADYEAAMKEEQDATAEFYSEPTVFKAVK